jgi:outer membrane protein
MRWGAGGEVVPRGLGRKALWPSASRLNTKGTGMKFAVCAVVVAVSVGAALAAPEGPQPLTLGQAVDTAVHNQASVAIAGTQVRQAQSGLTVARSAYYPQLLADWRYSFTDVHDAQVSVGGVTATASGSTEQHQSTLATTYTLFDSGLRRAQLHGARASLDQASSGLDLTRVGLTNQVATAYFALLHDQRAATVARERVDQAQLHLNEVLARIDAGLAANVDRYPLDTELAQARLALIQAENAVRQDSISLSNIMGLTANQEYQAQEPPAEPNIAGLASAEDAVAAAERTRPDVLQARAAARFASASLEQARVSSRPVLSVNASHLWTVEPAPSGTELVLGAEVSFPIFDAGARRAQTESARQGLSAADLRLAQLRKDVTAQVTQARLAATTAWESMNASAVSVTAAREALRSAEARYQAGLAIPIEITDAQIAYYNAELDAAAARYNYFTALTALRNAVGLPTRDFTDLGEARILQP